MYEIIADNREAASNLPALLKELGLNVRFEQLAVGDYILSDEIAIERKTINDFISSLFDGRLFRQVSDLTSVYRQPVLLVEGDITIIPSLVNNVKVYYGALASLTINFPIKLIFVPSLNESAIFIERLVYNLNKEQRPHNIVKEKGQSIREQQLNLMASLPGVGEKLAEKLLKHFGTPIKAFNASQTALAEVIGYAKAQKVKQLLESKFEEQIENEKNQSKLM
ncbi:MAG: ERCC4 domain-containing protein [Conexivisphaerales archaeon]|nr:ERCC4 domain-containing protein [Conexivisphaerales archaeon]